MAEKQTILNLDSMMDDTLDAIPDAPDFMNPPDGLYHILLKDAKTDKYNPKDAPDTEIPRIKILYSVIKTIETKDLPVPEGSMFSETFQATEQGLGYFKNRAKAVLNVSDLAGVPLRDIYDSLKGVEFNARLTIKKTTGKDGTEYENIQLRVIPPSQEAQAA